MKTLTLIKNSTVETDMSTYNQCKAVAHKAYEYQIEVTTTDKLDSDGWIIDHSVIHDVIKNVIQNRMGSCEELSIRSLDDVARKLNEHGCDVRAINFTIKPVGSNAFIKSELRL
jgi:hypothetical protein